MEELIKKFISQLQHAIEIAEAVKLNFKNKKFDKVYVAGLGGSGIGATIIQDYLFDKLTIPFIVSKDYKIGASVNSKTLFVACSYSGNTEETIACLEEAQKRNATIAIITSGGVLKNKATKENLPHILIPSGMPPRTCLGYSITQLLQILFAANLVEESPRKLIEPAIKLLLKEQKEIEKNAKLIAKKCIDKKIVAYSFAGMEGITIRFRQQINENSKMLCWHNILPEMTHNEILGWNKIEKDIAVIIFKDQKGFPKTEKRLQFLLNEIKKYTSNIQIIESKGKTYFEKAFYFIHFGDWISLNLANLRKIDAINIDVINNLKKTMNEKKG